MLNENNFQFGAIVHYYYQFFFLNNNNLDEANSSKLDNKLKKYPNQKSDYSVMIN